MKSWHPDISFNQIFHRTQQLVVCSVRITVPLVMHMCVDQCTCVSCVCGCGCGCGCGCASVRTCVCVCLSCSLSSSSSFNGLQSNVVGWHHACLSSGCNSATLPSRFRFCDVDDHITLCKGYLGLIRSSVVVQCEP